MGLFQRWAIQLVFLCFAFYYLRITFFAPEAAQAAAWTKGLVFFQGSPLGVFFERLFSKQLANGFLLTLRAVTLAFGLLGIIATYKLGFLLYNKRIGFVAALFSLSTIALFQFQQDGHPLLVAYGITIFTTWRFMEWVYYRKSSQFLLAIIGLFLLLFLFGFMAMLLPLVCLVSYYLGKGNYRALLAFFRSREWWFFLLIITFTTGIFTLLTGDWQIVAQFQWNFLKHPFENSAVFIDGPYALSLPFGAVLLIAVVWRYFDLIRNFFSSRAHQEWLTPAAVLFSGLLLLRFPNHFPTLLLIALPYLTIIAAEYVLRMILEHKGVIIIVLRIVQLVANVFLVYALAHHLPPVSTYRFVLAGSFLVLALYQWLQQREPLDQVILSGTFTSLAALAVYDSLIW